MRYGIRMLAVVLIAGCSLEYDGDILSLERSEADTGTSDPRDPDASSDPCIVDTDGDGVEDCLDQCWYLREDDDGIADLDGCPEEDADDDGVLDFVDQCPQLAEDADGYDDGDGCPDSSSAPDAGTGCLPSSMPELCNGLDDNCNGLVDETFSVGLPCAAGVGACAAAGNYFCGLDGTQQCSALPRNPQPETCNGLDDDCDGLYDDGLDVGLPCSSGAGICARSGTLSPS